MLLPKPGQPGRGLLAQEVPNRLGDSHFVLAVASTGCHSGQDERHCPQGKRDSGWGGSPFHRYQCLLLPIPFQSYITSTLSEPKPQLLPQVHVLVPPIFQTPAPPEEQESCSNFIIII